MASPSPSPIQWLSHQINIRNTQSSSPVFSLSVITCFTVFHIFAPYYPQPKQRAWILTALASLFMTISSIPFACDWAIAGGDVAAVRFRNGGGSNTIILDDISVWIPDGLALIVLRAFQAYLFCDLAIGKFYYPSELSLLTGWIHHILYICICDYAIRRNWCHVFCLAALMELPTTQLAFARLIPRLRSDTLFAISFFVLRIVYCVVLIVSYLSRGNRVGLLEGSFVPAGVLMMAFGMHCVWFWGCVKGIVRRAGSKAKAKSKTMSNLTTKVADDTLVELKLANMGNGSSEEDEAEIDLAVLVKEPMSLPVSPSGAVGFEKIEVESSKRREEEEIYFLPPLIDSVPSTSSSRSSLLSSTSSSPSSSTILKPKRVQALRESGVDLDLEMDVGLGVKSRSSSIPSSPSSSSFSSSSSSSSSSSYTYNNYTYTIPGSFPRTRTRPQITRSPSLTESAKLRAAKIRERCREYKERYAPALGLGLPVLPGLSLPGLGLGGLGLDRRVIFEYVGLGSGVSGDAGGDAHREARMGVGMGMGMGMGMEGVREVAVY